MDMSKENSSLDVSEKIQLLLPSIVQNVVTVNIVAVFWPSKKRQYWGCLPWFKTLLRLRENIFELNQTKQVCPMTLTSIVSPAPSIVSPVFWWEKKGTIKGNFTVEIISIATFFRWLDHELFENLMKKSIIFHAAWSSAKIIAKQRIFVLLFRPQILNHF